MMNGNFIAGNKNLTDPIPEADGIDIHEKSLEKEFDSFMSNSFGFGGTNVSLVLSKFKN
jgi:3-oxoacyl-[acyl-carrier-protein] synthase-1